METRPLGEMQQAQGGDVEPGRGPMPPAAAPPPPPVDDPAPIGDRARVADAASVAETEAAGRDDGLDPELQSAAPRATMSREDVYMRPMRAGKPVSTGPVARAMTWLKYTLSSELQRREWLVDERLAQVPPMTRPNTVAVISPKGGVGKTTISFVLGNLLASQLRMRVVALDANPDFGTLASLAPDDFRSQRSLADLLADSTEIDSPAELHPYVARLPTGLHLLGAPAHAEVMGQMTPGLYSRLLDFLEKFYEVVILDLGTGITDPLAQFAVDRADQTVVITTPEWVTAAGVLGALRYLQLEQGTLVLNQAPGGRHAGNREVVKANFRRHAVETSATIPYDDRLRVMLDTGTYSLDELRLSTRAPVKELGAAIAFKFV